MAQQHFDDNPQTLADCIANLKVIGPGLGVTWRQLETIFAQQTDPQSVEILGWLKTWHPVQNAAGYALEHLLGQPDGAFGAGGGPKGPPPW